MSLIRRVPYSGCSRRSVATASRFAVAAADVLFGFAPTRAGAKPSSPPVWYRFTHWCSVALFTPKIRPTSPNDTFRSSTSRTSRTRNSNGCTLRDR